MDCQQKLILARTSLYERQELNRSGRGPMKILVVEDEMIIGAKISIYLTELGYEVTGVIPRAEEALLHVQENVPDIALLDIRLKGAMDGIALGEILNEQYQIPVVFLTANTDDATFEEAKKARPYAFLAKPFGKQDLKRALELTLNLLSGESQSESSHFDDIPSSNQPLSDRFFVYDGEKRVRILFDHVLYIKAERNYCRIITESKEYLLSMPMKSLEGELPPDLFQRIHRSYIVNLKHVDEIDNQVVRLGSHSLTISQAFLKPFLQRIKSV